MDKLKFGEQVYGMWNDFSMYFKSIDMFNKHVILSHCLLKAKTIEIWQNNIFVG